MDLMNAFNRESISLFNSPLESAIRSVVLLDALYPLKVDLSELTWLHYLLVHSADADGPPSLHPDIPQRGGELKVNRKTVELGLAVLRRMHYADLVVDDAGMRYEATDFAAAFVELLHASYTESMKERAAWIAVQVRERGLASLEEALRASVGRWTTEFAQPQTPIANLL